MDRKSFIRILGASTLGLGVQPLRALESLQNFPATERMPVLFLGHGSPMNAIEDNVFVQGFRRIAATLPRPRAILCVSAHWNTRGTYLTAMDMPRTIHDFGGFPDALYAVQYPAPGSPQLAEEATRLLSPETAMADYSWGLDHGAWSVLKHLFPAADIPVIQLSLDVGKTPEQHAELARRLLPLRRKGVLIVGSGNIVHNLGLVDWKNLNAIDYGFDWAVEARQICNQWIATGDLRSLAQYASKGSALRMAVPTPEHFLPLLYSLALREEDERPTFFNDHLLAGSLSMTSVILG